MDVTKVLGRRTCCPSARRKPAWFKVPPPGSAKYRELQPPIEDEGLHTVCQEAACPNVGDCWERGTATFMILGDTCTRRCGFCNVKTGKPTWNDPLEPLRVARSRRPHGPAPRGRSPPSTATTCPTTARSVWCGVIRSIRLQAPGCKVECLTPDFRGEEMPLAKVIAERPDVFNHNVEVAPRLYPVARRGSTWKRSLRVLRNAQRWARARSRPSPASWSASARPTTRWSTRSADLREAGRPGPHRRPVPAPDRAPPAGRALLAPGRVRGAGARPPTRSASSTSPPARWCARATTPTSTSRRRPKPVPERRSARRRGAAGASRPRSAPPHRR